jgi:hypothetical protein
VPRRYDASLLAGWAAAGVSEVLFGMPDREPPEVLAYLGRLAGRVGFEV